VQPKSGGRKVFFYGLSGVPQRNAAIGETLKFKEKKLL
jgi:hypothetical protein